LHDALHRGVEGSVESAVVHDAEHHVRVVDDHALAPRTAFQLGPSLANSVVGSAGGDVGMDPSLPVEISQF
jgi:hypothetical protein